jgi:flagellar protein FlaG
VFDKEIIMFNSIDGYGIRKMAATQSVGSQNAISKTNETPKTTSPSADVAMQAKQTVMVDKAAIKEAVGKLNETVAPALQTVQFTMDEESDRVIVKVVDKATQKVIRQMPNEEVLAFSKTLDKLQGLVIRQTA